MDLFGVSFVQFFWSIFFSKHGIILPSSFCLFTLKFLVDVCFDN